MQLWWEEGSREGGDGLGLRLEEKKWLDRSNLLVVLLWDLLWECMDMRRVTEE